MKITENHKVVKIIYWLWFITDHYTNIQHNISRVSNVLIYFYDKFGKRGSIFIIFFTVKFRKDLQKKEVKLPSPLKSVAALPCKT